MSQSHINNFYLWGFCELKEYLVQYDDDPNREQWAVYNVCANKGFHNHEKRWILYFDHVKVTVIQWQNCILSSDLLKIRVDSDVYSLYLFMLMLFVYFLECGMNVHHKCQTKVANLCGINQKLLAEALNQVSQVCRVSTTVLLYFPS